jgi:hypothetical protein
MFGEEHWASKYCITLWYHTTTWIACGRLIYCITNLMLTTHIVQKLLLQSLYAGSRNVLWNSKFDCKEQLVFPENLSRVRQWRNHKGGVIIQLHYSLQLPEFRTKITEKLVRLKAINICKVERYEMPYASLYAWFLIPLLRKWLLGSSDYLVNIWGICMISVAQNEVVCGQSPSG